MQKSRKLKRVLQATVVLLIAWLVIGVIDYCCVINEKRPIFCINASGDVYGVYHGLGYSFETYPHPVTGKIEYAYYIFGVQVESNFTNSAIPIE